MNKKKIRLADLFKSITAANTEVTTEALAVLNEALECAGRHAVELLAKENVSWQ